MTRFINQLREDDNKFKKRSKIIKLGLYLSLLIIFGKVFYLQIIDNKKPLKFARQEEKPLNVAGQRGEIRDSDGTPLAVSEPAPSIHINPREIKDKPYYIKQLSKILDISKKTLSNKLASKKQFVYIKRHATFEEAEKIKKLNLTLKKLGYTQLGIQIEQKRVYPQHHLAGQVLGHTSKYDLIGLEGIEKQYNRYLKGEEKTIKIYKDGRGKTITKNITESDKAKKGYNLTLTIKSNWQMILEDVLAAQVKKANALNGYGVIMHPKTGEIYAMVSYPFFNPNNYSHENHKYKKNLPVWKTFEPGSVMKSVLVASALDERVIEEHSVLDCENGERRIGNHTIHDINKRGESNITEILVYSSNICASKIADKMPNETYYNYLTSRFGFGKKTNIDIPGEAKGKVLQPEKWGDIERANIAFGQGIAVSSIQLAQAVSIIANGGNFVDPYLVKSIDSSDGKNIWIKKYKRGDRVLRYETSKKMRRMLQVVVERGAKKARIKGVSVSGKTGTAQKVINGKYSKKNIVSIIGFLPSENPQLVAVITIDEPKGQNAYGGIWAAPVFRDAMERIWLNEDNIEKLASNDSVPSFIGIGKREALRIAEAKKIKIKIHGNGFVHRQDPVAGEKYESNDEIRLFLEPGI